MTNTLEIHSHDVFYFYQLLLFARHDGLYALFYRANGQNLFELFIFIFNLFSFKMNISKID